MIRDFVEFDCGTHSFIAISAAHFGQINMVRYLLENDAAVEKSTNIGYTPLHQAAQQGHTLIINLLLKHKADPNAVTNVSIIKERSLNLRIFFTLNFPSLHRMDKQL